MIDIITTDIATTNPTVRAMIEESGERRSSIKDRGLPENQILICVDPPRGFYLSNGHYQQTEGWVVAEGVMSARELESFFAMFGSSWLIWLESILAGQYPVRAFIKDGNDDWNFSVDTSRPAK